MWHLAGVRWRCREGWLVESWKDYRMERDIGGRMSRGDQLSQRGQRRGVGSMTLVRGHHTLFWRQSEWILMTYAII
jgi:hypothetical protein